MTNRHRFAMPTLTKGEVIRPMGNVPRNRAVVALQGLPVVIPVDRHGHRIGGKGAEKARGRLSIRDYTPFFQSCGFLMNPPGLTIPTGTRPGAGGSVTEGDLTPPLENRPLSQKGGQLAFRGLEAPPLFWSRGRFTKVKTLRPQTKRCARQRAAIASAVIKTCARSAFTALKVHTW